MHILIYGCGLLTSLLLPSLLEGGHQIVVLGPDADRMAQLPDLPQLDGIVTSEPLMHDYLQQGGVAHADAFLALSDDDHLNLLFAQIAQQIFNVPQVMCLLASPYLQQLYSELGLKVIGPNADLVQELRQGVLN